MNNDIYKELASAMYALEKRSHNKIYLINTDIEKNAQKLYCTFISTFKNAEIVYEPAYSQIIVSADTYVLDIYSNEHKEVFFSADVICIDSIINGMLHIECVFNNAFRMAGEIYGQQ